MKWITLFFFLASVSAQASLYCALGDKTPSQYITSSPYATLQIDPLDQPNIQVFLTDYYNGIDSTFVLKFTGKISSKIDGIFAGTYINIKNNENSFFAEKNDRISFTLGKKIFTCEIL